MLCPIVAATDADQVLALSLAKEFGLPLLEQSPHEVVRSDAQPRSTWVLMVTSGRVALCDQSNGRVLVTDSPPKRYQVRKSDLLGRAVGGAHRGNESVIDATAGLGGDAIQLAMMGFTVACIERCPVVGVLLTSRVAQLPHEWQARLSVSIGDSIEVLNAMQPADVVYLDPMYPPKRRASALPPLEIQVLRQLVGDDADASDLFSAARSLALQRVVVKRPTYAPPIAPDPEGQHSGKLVRFDIYSKAKT